MNAFLTPAKTAQLLLTLGPTRRLVFKLHYLQMAESVISGQPRDEVAERFNTTAQSVKRTTQRITAHLYEQAFKGQEAPFAYVKEIHLLRTPQQRPYWLYMLRELIKATTEGWMPGLPTEEKIQELFEEHVDGVLCLRNLRLCLRFIEENAYQSDIGRIDYEYSARLFRTLYIRCVHRSDRDRFPYVETLLQLQSERQRQYWIALLNLLIQRYPTHPHLLLKAA